MEAQPGNPDGDTVRYSQQPGCIWQGATPTLPDVEGEVMRYSPSPSSQPQDRQEEASWKASFSGTFQAKSGSLQLKPRPGTCADFRVFCERVLVFCHLLTFSTVSSKVSVDSAPFLLIHAMYNSLFSKTSILWLRVAVQTCI